jgi:hypothetical protein
MNVLLLIFIVIFLIFVWLLCFLGSIVELQQGQYFAVIPLISCIGTVIATLFLIYNSVQLRQFGTSLTEAQKQEKDTYIKGQNDSLLAIYITIGISACFSFGLFFLEFI